MSILEKRKFLKEMDELLQEMEENRKIEQNFFQTIQDTKNNSNGSDSQQIPLVLVISTRNVVMKGNQINPAVRM